MALQLTIKIEGREEADLQTALDEVGRELRQGARGPLLTYHDTHCWEFEVTGAPEPEED
jgi:hypothetical protein